MWRSKSSSAQLAGACGRSNSGVCRTRFARLLPEQAVSQLHPASWMYAAAEQQSLSGAEQQSLSYLSVGNSRAMMWKAVCNTTHR